MKAVSLTGALSEAWAWARDDGPYPSRDGFWNAQTAALVVQTAATSTIPMTFILVQNMA